jgi:hypothetical protein
VHLLQPNRPADFYARHLRRWLDWAVPTCVIVRADAAVLFALLYANAAHSLGARAVWRETWRRGTLLAVCSLGISFFWHKYILDTNF